MKLILACLMVPTHMQAFQDNVPVMVFLSRFTIPLFFITSAYFFFLGVEKKPNDLQWRRTRLKKFLLRVLKLYLAWELLQLPITVRNWGGPNITEPGGLKYFLIRLFLGNTFFASWYLKALMLGIVTVTLLARKLSNGSLFVLGLAAYVLCCLNSGYRGLELLQIRGLSVSNTFLAAIVWLVTGKIIAENKPDLSAFHGWKGEKKLIALLITLALYVLEYCLCVKKGWAEQTDNMLFLIPVCTLVFMLVLECGIKLKHASDMRTASTVIYCAHGSVMALLYSLGNRIGTDFESPPMAYLCYIMILVLCLAGGICINRLKGRKKLSWLSWLC